MIFFINNCYEQLALPQPAGPQLLPPSLAEESDDEPPSLLAVDPLSEELLPDAEAELPEPLAEPEVSDFFPPSRKSVTYQPLPLRIKAVRLSSLTNGPCLQAGHSAGAGSLIFCITSCTAPQDLHSNS
jgi:hypothetical protein